MARVGIDVSHALGVSMPHIRAIAKTCGTDHAARARALGARRSTKPACSPPSSADPSSHDVRPDGGVGRRHRLVGSVRLRRGRLRSSSRRRGRDPRLGRTTGGVREALRVLDDRATCRVGEGRARPRVPRLLPVDPARRGRPSQRGQEGRVVGAQADREAEPRAPRSGHRGSEPDPGAGRPRPRDGSPATSSGSSRARRPAPGSRTDVVPQTSLDRVPGLAGLDELRRRVRDSTRRSAASWPSTSSFGSHSSQLGRYQLQVAEQLHRRRHQDRPHDRRVQEDGDREAEPHLLRAARAVPRRSRRTRRP